MKIVQLDITDPDAYTLGYNTLIGQLQESANSICQTPCEECFAPFDPFNISGLTSKVCGLFTTNISYFIDYGAGNSTFEDLTSVNGSGSDIGPLDVGRYSDEYCIQYTGDKYSNSEVCFTVVTEVATNTDFGVQYCNITYNDVLCNSCTRSNQCIVADCTTVDATHGTMIDTCQLKGGNGPFEIIFVLLGADNTTFTTGSCDIDVPAPTVLPAPSVLAPIEPAPIVPVRAPLKAPTTNTPSMSNGYSSALTLPFSHIALATISMAIFV